MPRGFMGRPATAFLTRIADAHTQAKDSSTRITSNAPSNAAVRERRLPFEPSEGNSGGMVPTGRGNSSNIAVSYDEYDYLSRMICNAEDKLGECLYQVACEIEELCNTSFILPDAAPRCLNISESVKQYMTDFRGVTQDSAIRIRQFADEITTIG